MTDKSDFICSCGKERMAADKVYQWALEYLDSSPEKFVTDVVCELQIEHNAEVIGIPFDQWARVDAQNYDKSFRTFVQCDRVEDGLARTLQLFVENAEIDEQ